MAPDFRIVSVKCQSKQVVGRCIETWYNQHRRHSALDYQTPNERYYALTRPPWPPEGNPPKTRAQPNRP